MPAGRTTPYIGLSAFKEADAEWFFGRETEKRILIANLRVSRLTLFYAVSGVGKSSLLRAGVASRLVELASNEDAEHGSPDEIPVVFDSWRDDPLDRLIGEIERSIAPFVHQNEVVELPRDRLDEAVAKAIETVDANLLIILDQFEEIFYNVERSRQDHLAGELARCINRSDLRANFLIGIREDAYAGLGDLFNGRIANVYGNYIHLDYLDRQAAREAIEGPIAVFNAAHRDEAPYTWEPGLVEEVLSAAAPEEGEQGVAPGQDGVGDRGRRVETPLLQLVMTKLWEAEHDEGSHTLRLATLNRLGGAKMIVRRHADATLDSLPPEYHDVAADVFDYMVTPSGTKIAHQIPSLAHWTGHSEDKIQELFRRLSKAPDLILRQVPSPPGSDAPPSYEIFHDVLAPAILDWQGRQASLQLRKEKEEAQHQTRIQRRRARIAWISAAVSLILLLVSIAFYANSVANRDAAQSRQLAADAENNLSSDPELSTLLALSALGKSPTQQAQAALRDAYENVQERRTFKAGGGSILSVAFSPDGKSLVAGTSDGDAEVWNLSRPSDQASLLYTTYYYVSGVAFSPDGHNVVVTGTSDDPIPSFQVFPDDGNGSPITVNAPTGGDNSGGVNGIAYNSAGTLIATVNSDGQLCVFSVPKYSGHCTSGSKSDSLSAVAFDPTGTRVVVTGGVGGATVWSVPDLAPVTTIPEGADYFLSAAFNPVNGNELTTVSEQGQTLEWDISGPQPIQIATLDTEGLTEAALYSTDGGELFTTDDLGQTTGWDPTTGTVTAQLNCQCGVVRTVAVDPVGDNHEIATGGDDGEIRLWYTAPRELRSVSKPYQGGLYFAFFDGNSQSLILGVKNSVEIENPRTGKSDSISADAADVDTAVPGTLVTADSKGRVTTWSLPAGSVVPVSQHVVSPTSIDATHVAISQNGNWIAYSGDTGEIFIKNLVTGESAGLQGSSQDSDTIESIALNNSGSRVLVGYNEDYAKIWNTTKISGSAGKAEAASLGNFTEGSFPNALVLDAEFSPNGQQVALADTDGNATIFNTVNRQEVGRSLSAGTGQINSVAFNSSGSQIVTSGDDGVTRIWDVASGTQLSAFGPSDDPFPKATDSAVFSPNGSEILTVSNDSMFRAWSTEAADPLSQVEAAARQRLTRGYTAVERSEYLNVAGG